MLPSEVARDFNLYFQPSGTTECFAKGPEGLPECLRTVSSRHFAAADNLLSTLAKASSLGFSPQDSAGLEAVVGAMELASVHNAALQIDHYNWLDDRLLGNSTAEFSHPECWAMSTNVMGENYGGCYILNTMDSPHPGAADEVYDASVKHLRALASVGDNGAQDGSWSLLVGLLLAEPAYDFKRCELPWFTAPVEQ